MRQHQIKSYMLILIQLSFNIHLKRKSCAAARCSSISCLESSHGSIAWSSGSRTRLDMKSACCLATLKKTGNYPPPTCDWISCSPCGSRTVSAWFCCECGRGSFCFRGYSWKHVRSWNGKQISTPKKIFLSLRIYILFQSSWWAFRPKHDLLLCRYLQTWDELSCSLLRAKL